MVEELRQRREYDEHHDERSEYLGEKYEALMKEVEVLRMLLSQTIVSLIVGPKWLKSND
jgi:DNA-binding ferritin-like protein (Dps family)